MCTNVQFLDKPLGDTTLIVMLQNAHSVILTHCLLKGGFLQSTAIITNIRQKALMQPSRFYITFDSVLVLVNTNMFRI